MSARRADDLGEGDLEVFGIGDGWDVEVVCGLPYEAGGRRSGVVEEAVNCSRRGGRAEPQRRLRGGGDGSVGQDMDMGLLWRG